MKIRNAIALGAMVAATFTTFAAEPGADTYKAKCQMCHGATGLADSGAGKTMKVKPITDPTVTKLTEAEDDCGNQEWHGQDAAVQRQAD